MRGIQYFDFVEVFHCLTALESNMLMVMTVPTVLKVPFEKAAPLALPTFWHPWIRITTILNLRYRTQDLLYGELFPPTLLDCGHWRTLFTRLQ